MVEEYTVGYILSRNVNLSPLDTKEIEDAVKTFLGIKNRKNNAAVIPLDKNDRMYFVVTGINGSWSQFTVNLEVYRSDIGRFERATGVKFEDFLKSLEDELAEKLERVAEVKAAISVLSKDFLQKLMKDAKKK